MQTTKQWPDGSGAVTLSYTGQGDGALSVTADANDGLDRAVTLIVTDGTKQVPVSVTQQGKREEFVTSDGSILTTNDGGTFAVIKHEYIQE